MPDTAVEVPFVLFSAGRSVSPQRETSYQEEGERFGLAR
jgi:hypothetical protein